MTRVKHHSLDTGHTSTVRVFDLPITEHAAELKAASDYMLLLVAQDNGTDDVYYLSEG